MYQFAHKEILNFLALLPLLIGAFWMVRHLSKKAINRFGDPKLMESLMPEESTFRKHLKFYIFILATAFLIFGISGFQVGSKMEEAKHEGVELIIALDISNSMMAEDILPNRIERAKQAISRLLDELLYDRFGLIVFAGEAFTQLPITTDYAAAKMMLQTIDTRIAPVQGTSIGAAINLASKSFTQDEAKNRAIIIITDGENHEDDAVKAAQDARQKGIIVHTIGMGLPKGAPIPIGSGKGNYQTNIKGEVVISKLDETTLIQVAQEGGGNYFRANNTSTGLKELFREINKLEKQELETKIFAEYEDQFQLIIGIAFLLYLLEFIILERKNKYLRKIKLF